MGPALTDQILHLLQAAGTEGVPYADIIARCGGKSANAYRVIHHLRAQRYDVQSTRCSTTSLVSLGPCRHISSRALLEQRINAAGPGGVGRKDLMAGLSLGAFNQALRDVKAAGLCFGSRGAARGQTRYFAQAEHRAAHRASCAPITPAAAAERRRAKNRERQQARRNARRNADPAVTPKPATPAKKPLFKVRLDDAAGPATYLPTCKHTVAPTPAPWWQVQGPVPAAVDPQACRPWAVAAARQIHAGAATAGETD